MKANYMGQIPIIIKDHYNINNDLFALKAKSNFIDLIHLYTLIIYYHIINLIDTFKASVLFYNFFIIFSFILVDM